MSTSSLGIIDAKKDAMSGVISEYSTLVSTQIIDLWNKFRLVSIEEITGSAYTGNDIDRDFWKEWIEYYGTAGTENGDVVDDAKTGFNAFIIAQGGSEIVDIIDAEKEFWNLMVDLSFSIFLPQENLLFDSNKDSFTVEYPVLDEDYKPTGVWTETENKVAYNIYLWADGGADTIEIAGLNASEEISYILRRSEVNSNETATANASGVVSISMLADDKITHAYREDDVSKISILTREITSINCSNIYVPSDSTSGSVDVFGVTLEDYLAGGGYPSNCRWIFDEIVDNDIFARNNTDFWFAEFNGIYDYDSGNVRQFNVDTLINIEKMASMMSGNFRIFSELDVNGDLKRVVAYSTVDDTETAEKIVKAVKRTSDTDVTPYDLFLNKNAVMFNTDGMEASVGYKGQIYINNGDSLYGTLVFSTIGQSIQQIITELSPSKKYLITGNKTGDGSFRFYLGFFNNLYTYFDVDSATTGDFAFVGSPTAPTNDRLVARWIGDGTSLTISNLQVQEIGDIISEVYSISSNVVLSQTDKTKQGYKLQNGNVKFTTLTEYAFGEAITGTVELNGETVTLIDNTELTYADLQALTTPTDELVSIKISTT